MSNLAKCIYCGEKTKWRVLELTTPGKTNNKYDLWSIAVCDEHQNNLVARLSYFLQIENRNLSWKERFSYLRSFIKYRPKKEVKSEVNKLVNKKIKEVENVVDR